MSCKICGRGACASWMHNVEEQTEYESVEDMDENQLRREIIDLRRENADLQSENEKLRENNV